VVQRMPSGYRSRSCSCDALAARPRVRRAHVRGDQRRRGARLTLHRARPAHRLGGRRVFVVGAGVAEEDVVAGHRGSILEGEPRRHPEREPCERDGSGWADLSVPQIHPVAEAQDRRNRDVGSALVAR
jgi:hypothetical protein